MVLMSLSAVAVMASTSPLMRESTVASKISESGSRLWTSGQVLLFSQELII